MCRGSRSESSPYVAVRGRWISTYWETNLDAVWGGLWGPARPPSQPPAWRASGQRRVPAPRSATTARPHEVGAFNQAKLAYASQSQHFGAPFFQPGASAKHDMDLLAQRHPNEEDVADMVAKLRTRPSAQEPDGCNLTLTRKCHIPIHLSHNGGTEKVASVRRDRINDHPCSSVSRCPLGDTRAA